MQPTSKPEQKSYRKGSSLYFSAGLVLSLVLVVTAFEWKTPYVVLPDGPIEIGDPADNMIIDNVIIPLRTAPKEKTGEIVPVKNPPVDLDPIKVDPPTFHDPTATEPGNDPIMIPGAGIPTEPTPPVANFSKAAEPADGYEAFYAYLYKHLTIPDHLISQNKSGRIHVSFVIDTDGRLTDIEIVKGLDKQLEKQIIKILQDSPTWEPAWNEGRKVKARMQLPVVIKINN